MYQSNSVRRTAVLLLALCLFLGISVGMVGCAADDAMADVVGGLINNLPASGEKASTPEEALQQFFAALKAQDAKAMLACCDIEGYCDRFSFTDFTDRLRISSAITGGAPTEYPFYRELMACERRRDFAFRIRVLTYSLLLTEEEWTDYVNNLTPVKADGAWAEKFAEAADPALLQNLEVLRIDKNAPDLQDDSRIQDNFRRAYYAEENISMSALLKVDDELFCKSFILSKINGGWQISVVGSPLMSGENANGGAAAVESEAVYEVLIA